MKFLYEACKNSPNLSFWQNKNNLLFGWLNIKVYYLMDCGVTLNLMTFHSVLASCTFSMITETAKPAYSNTYSRLHGCSADACSTAVCGSRSRDMRSRPLAPGAALAARRTPPWLDAWLIPTIPAQWDLLFHSSFY